MERFMEMWLLAGLDYLFGWFTPFYGFYCTLQMTGVLFLFFFYLLHIQVIGLFIGYFPVRPVFKRSE